MQTIRELREAQGWTPMELATVLGVSLATVYNWEADKHEPRATQLRDIARAFGVSMESIHIPGDRERKSGT
ncbi:MAG: helix-turn-helix transcriptional regulator [Thermomicrobiales bacterium]